MNRAKFLALFSGMALLPACAGIAASAIFPTAISVLKQVGAFINFAEYWMSLFRAAPISQNLIAAIDEGLVKLRSALQRFEKILADKSASTEDVKAVYEDLRGVLDSVIAALEAAQLYNVEKKGFVKHPSMRSLRADGTSPDLVVHIELPPETL